MKRRASSEVTNLSSIIKSVFHVTKPFFMVVSPYSTRVFSKYVAPSTAD